MRACFHSPMINVYADNENNEFLHFIVELEHTGHKNLITETYMFVKTTYYNDVSILVQISRRKEVCFHRDIS